MLGNQQKLLTNVTKEKGYTNLLIFCDDGISVVTMNRTGLREMVQTIKARKASAVLIKDMSRLGRNYIAIPSETEIKRMSCSGKNSSVSRPTSSSTLIDHNGLSVQRTGDRSLKQSVSDTSPPLTISAIPFIWKMTAGLSLTKSLTERLSCLTRACIPITRAMNIEYFEQEFYRNPLNVVEATTAEVVSPSVPEMPAVETAPTATTARADFVKSKLESGEKFTSAELFAGAAKAYGDTMANNAFTSKDAYDAMELGVNQYVLSLDDVALDDMLTMVNYYPRKQGAPPIWRGFISFPPRRALPFLRT